MVRFKKQTDFQFPFLTSETTSTIQVSNSSYLDFADRVLSIFASTFFFAILLAISLDNPNSTNSSSSSLISQISSDVELQLPLANFEKKEIQNKSIETPKIPKKKISDLVISKVETPSKKKIDVAVSKATQSSFQPISKVEKNEFPVLNKTIDHEKIYLNQARTSSEIKNSMVKTPTTKTKVSPKPVFIDHHIEDQTLVINNKITQDLLPLSYFHAKEKAAKENKLMYIKFGAKWCLPCRQMEKTTYKDQRVKDFSEKNYVSISVDVDDFDGVNMKSYFNVKFLPTLLIFNSQGNFIAKYVNYQSAESMLEILEKHKSEYEIIPVITSNEVQASPKIATPIVEKIVSINFNKVVLSKKRNGNAISFVKSKAKNWRYTQLDFSAKNISEGELLLQIKETNTGFNLTELNLPVIKNQGIADTTTTNFQLVLEHEKRKKKNGEYVVEIYHLTQNDSMLVGKTTLLKDGEILF